MNASSFCESVAATGLAKPLMPPSSVQAPPAMGDAGDVAMGGNATDKILGQDAAPVPEDGKAGGCESSCEHITRCPLAGDPCWP